eukprot:TRINITY_DN2141_c1_g1_i3.p1 TRINITY_DN2141_c1_g1~~TRINITY_DN2141_c1_g1_i3.p1  ORF type:complete len:237 (+),score=63.36 TRINITY_DN2141_c1_g1_i3:76-786(+)
MPGAMKRPAAFISEPVQAAPPKRQAFDSSGVVDDLQARLLAAEKRAYDAELKLARVQEKADLLERIAEKAEAEMKEQSTKLSTVEARVAHAEGRAEVFANQAQAASGVVERAARAEARAEILGDLHTKLPLLVRAVVASVSDQPWQPQGSSGLPLRGSIKMELEDAVQMKGDSYGVAPVATSEKPYDEADNVAQEEAAAEQDKESGTRHVPSAGRGGFMQRAMGALAGRQQRKLKL